MRLDVLGVEVPVALDRVGQARIAQHHGDFREQRCAARQALRRGAAPRRSGTAGAPSCRDPGCARESGAGDGVEADDWGSRRRSSSASMRSLRVEPLGVELVGDDAALGVDDDLAGDQPLAVAGERRARGRRNGSRRSTPTSAARNCRASSRRP